MRAVLLVVVLVALSQTALVALVSAGSAVADDEVYRASTWVTGNELKQHCRSDAGDFFQGVCSGFAIAVAQAVSRSRFLGWRACFPYGVTPRQLYDVMTKFLDENPELLHRSGGFLAAQAFGEAFPCSQ